MSKRSRTRASSRARTKTPKNPTLQRLRYERNDGNPIYCELCKDTINVGDLFAWWEVEGGRATMYCEKNGCHSSNVRNRKAIQ
jgi:hypothetical protein